MDRQEKKEIFENLYLNNLSLNDRKILNSSEEAEKLFFKQWENVHEMEDKSSLINESILFEKVQKRIKRQNVLQRPVIQYAAIIILLVSLSITGYFIFYPHSNSELVEFSTEKGQRMELNLPDGSKVWLRSNSSLSYPLDFKERNVYLKGEAYFDVQQKLHAFRVVTENYNVEVLGTKFIVSNYEERTLAYTILESGLVRIIQNDIPKELAPNEKYTLNKKTRSSTIETINTAPYSTWITNNLVFDNTSLSIIIDQLEKWYGIQIEANQNINLDKKYSLTIKDETPEEVFALFNEITPLHFKKQNNNFYISSPE